jgi:hypothetical protein
MIAVAACQFACGGDEDSPAYPGTGGVLGTGGSVGVGGIVGAGGTGGAVTPGSGGVPTTGGTSGTGGTANPPTGDLTGSTCARWGEVNGRTFLYRNNIWNEASASQKQCISVKETGKVGSFEVTESQISVNSGAPGSYPSIVHGWHWGKWTANSGLPKTLSSINTAQSSWSYVPVSGGKYNISYDIWLHPQNNPKEPDGGLELMIWTHQQGGAQPFGDPAGSIQLSGANWNVHKGQIGKWYYVAYVRTGGGNSVNLNLKEFFADVVKRGHAQNSWNLLSIQAGFEIWQGGQGLKTTSFTSTVN